jgi:hypothetical protein
MVYAGTGWMIAWTNWPQAAVGGMLPWLLWSVERSLQLRTVRSTVPVALSVASLLFGGFPAVTGWVIYATAGYVVVRLVIDARENPVRRLRTGAAQLLRLVLGLVLGIGLAAVQLAVFIVGFLGLDTSYRAGGFFATQPLRMALTTLFPNTWGINSHIFFTRTNPIESDAYFGAAAAVLCLLAVLVRPHPSVRRGVRAYFVAVALICGLLVYVQPPFMTWIGHLPIFSGNPIGRLVSIMLLALSFLAGMGADSLLRPQPRAHSARIAVAAVAAISGVVIVGLAAFVRHDVNAHRSADPMLAALPVTRWLEAALLCAGIVVLLVLVAQWRPKWAVAGFAVVPLLVAGQAVIAAAPMWEQVRADRFYPQTAKHRYLENHLGHARMATTGMTMVNGSTAYYGLRSATGHLFFPPGYSDLINRIAPQGRLTTTYWTLPAGLDLAAWQSPGLDRLSVRYLAADSDTALPGTTTPVTTGSDQARLPTRPIDIPLPPGPLRGFDLQFLSGTADTTAGYVVADLRDMNGRTVASTRRLVRFPRAQSALSVPLAAERVPAGPLTLRLSWAGPAGSPTVATDGAGVPAVTLVRPVDDGLRLVSDDDGEVWKRTTALPRIRWASSSTVIEKPAARAAVVADSRLDPRTVVLSSPGQPTQGKPATVHVENDSGDTVTADVDAQGAGYLVLADAIQTDWSVSVDGKPTAIVAADNAFGAVHVTAGEHQVSFTYTPRGGRIGTLATLVSLVILLGLALPPTLWSRLRRGVRGRHPR